MTKILVIDDNEMQHELMRCYAANHDDIMLQHANSMEEALDVFVEDMPDIVFLDNRLWPYNDFTETVPDLRKADYHGEIVIISSEVRDPVFRRMREYSVLTAIDKSAFSIGNFGGMVNSFERAVDPTLARSAC